MERCAPNAHALDIAVNSSDDPDVPAFSVNCKTCGLTLEAVAEEYAAFNAKASAWMRKVNGFQAPNQAVPPERMRPSELLPGASRPRLVQSGNMRDAEEIAADRALAEELTRGRRDFDEPGYDPGQDPHTYAVRNGRPLDDGIVSQPPPPKTHGRELNVDEAIRRIGQGDGASGVLGPTFG